MTSFFGGIATAVVPVGCGGCIGLSARGSYAVGCVAQMSKVRREEPVSEWVRDAWRVLERRFMVAARGACW